jgi:hypothetical protein
MRTSYPSGITREKFETVRYVLETAQKRTHLRSIDTYDIFCAVLYRLCFFVSATMLDRLLYLKTFSLPACRLVFCFVHKARYQLASSHKKTRI